jgi:hypothetical protein
MIIRTTSHRSRDKVKFVLGRHPTYYYTTKDCGCFIILEDDEEIDKVLKIKGVTKCRNQNRADYGKCWT